MSTTVDRVDIDLRSRLALGLNEVAAALRMVRGIASRPETQSGQPGR